MKYCEAKEYIKSDLYRYSGKVSSAAFIKTYLTNATFRLQVILRLYKADAFIPKNVSRVLWKFNKTKAKVRIPLVTKIGYGLFIAHGGPVVVNPTAVIGNNVNLSQFVTIGSNFENAAVIGDNTYIGPNVCIVENVKIGKNVTIGAGSVVTKDIPDNATAVGNYAKVINYNNPGQFTNNNRWICEKTFN